MLAALSLLAASLTSAPKPTIRVVLAGDAMLTGIPPGPHVFKGVANVFRAADATAANLEGPLTDCGTPYGRKTAAELKRRDQFVLKASPAHAAELAAAGIGLVSLANNHTMDYGPAGLTQEEEALQRAGIRFAGAGRNADAAIAPVVVCARNGRRIGLLSALAFVTTKALRKCGPATATEPGISVLNLRGRIDAEARRKIASWVGAAKRHCDFLIVALHWGVERKTLPNPYQVALGRAFAEAGADVVWGNHPHVLQGAEIYRGVPILYSMGNLVSALPAQGGLVAVDSRGGFSFMPTAVRSGKVLRLTGPAAKAARARFRTLCEALQRRYPSRWSRIP